MGSSGSSGGGGSSGKISWPSYFQDQHKRLMFEGVPTSSVDGSSNSEIHMETALLEAWDNSPYNAAVTYDPATEVEANEGELAELKVLIDAQDATTDWPALLDVVLAKIDAEFDNSTERLAVVEEYDRQKTPAYLREVGRFSAGMADVGASNSSAFAVGLAIMAMQNLQDTSGFAAKLALQDRSVKWQLTQAGTSEAMRLHMFNVEAKRNLTTTTTEVNRIDVLLNREYLDRDLELSVKDHLWNLELFQFGGNLLATAQGGIGPTQSKDQSSKTGGMTSMLGGGLSGAASGAMLGGMVGGPVGALIGGGIGLIAGGAMGGM